MTQKGVILSVVLTGALLALVISSIFWMLKQSVPGEEALEREALWQEPETSAPAPPSSEAPSSDPEAERRIRVTLYLLSSSGRTLTTEEREIPFADSLQEQAKQVIRQLLARGRSSPLPEGVRLRELFITPQGVAYVDLSQELITNHPGGTCGEELTVYGLANTLITNFPAVKSVRILVEGREVQSLAGHLDLTKSFGRGPEWLEQSSGP